MKEFTQEQPVDGETILHCGHIDNDQTFHWWKFKHEIYFRRPDETVGTAAWICLCSDCHRKSKGDISKVEIKGDGIWNGNEPIITKNE
jgi:hypothetical protein